MQLVKQQEGNDVYLRWSPVNVSDLAGYSIYYGTRDGYTYSGKVDVGNDTTYLLSGASVTDGIYVTAYDNLADGVNDLTEYYESWYEEAIRALAIILSATHVNCNGGSNGSVNLSTQYGFPPFSYDWSNGATTQDISNLAAGTYSVTVTDAQGFTATGSVEITEPDLLESSLLPDDITCYGGNDGGINATITGGTTSYSYRWTGPEGYTAYQEDVTGLAEGKYVLSVTDAKGCTLKDSVVLVYEHELPVPVITYPDSNKICDGDSLELDAGAGYTDYLWSTAETSRIIRVKTAGEYTVTVTDANGCSNTDDETITVYPLPTSSFSAPTSLCAEELAVLTYTGNATSSAAYDWLTDNGTIQSGSGQGPVSVNWSVAGIKKTGLIVLENGCQSDTSFNDIEVFQIPTSPFSLQSTVCDDENVIIEYHGNASPSANYNWQTYDANVVAGGGAGPVIVNWATGGIKTIQLTVDEDGCFSGITENQIYVAYPYEDEKLCLVTIDSLTGKNLLVWEKTPDAGILQYNLYRESEVSGVYTPMEEIPVGMLSVYVDDESNPEERQFLYKISVTDTCGNESELSPYHKTLFLQYVSSVGGVNLRWDKYEIEGNPVNFNSYIIFRGSDSTQMSQLLVISGSLESWKDTDPLALEGRQFYRIAGVKGDTCRPEGTELKAGAGPYAHSLSNLEDNRMKGTGTNSISAQQHLIVYPNPMTSSTNLRFHNRIGQAYTLYLTDLSGKVLRVTGNIQGSEYLLERKGLEKGYYIIQLVGEQSGSYKGNIVVQ